MEFLFRLLDVSDFPARWHCGRWSSGHGWLHIGSDLTIFAAYFSIPCILWYFASTKRSLPFRFIFALFGAFILFCGTTHLMEAIIFWWPAYRVAGLLKLATALVSVTTVVGLVKIVPIAFRMRTPEELEREIAARVKAETSLTQLNASLESTVATRTKELYELIEAIHTEREWFKTTLACIGDAVIATDAKGCVSNMNRIAESLTGWLESEALRKPLNEVFNIINEDSREVVENPATRALNEGVIVGLANHTILIAKDGRERNIDDSAAPIRDTEGKILGAVLVFRDISERSKVAKDLKRQADLTRAITNTLSTAVFLVDRDFKCTFVNPAAIAITGYSDSQLLGADVSAIGFPSDLMDALQSLAPDTMLSREMTITSSTQLAVPTRVNLQPLTLDQSAAGYVVEVTDLTTEKISAQRLEQSASEFQQLANAMPQIVWMADPSGKVTYFNNRWFEFTGFGPEFPIDNWSQILHAEDLDRCNRTWARAVANKTPYQIEYRFRDRLSNSYRWFLGRALPAYDSSGAIVRWFGSCTDIDDAIRAQDELRQVAAQLSEADRRKDEFIATLAHELRNPLAPIRTGLEVMKRAGDDTQLAAEVRTVMERQVVQLVTLVDDLLDVSRITRGKLELRMCELVVAEAVQNAVDASRPLIDELKHELVLESPTQGERMVGDPHRITQIISNLLNNAAKYTSEGGLIQLSVQVNEETVTFVVTDNGIGIPQDKSDYIFEMFSQLDRTMEHSFTGLGIGLTLVKTLVTLHRGSVSVHSDGENLGSTFTVVLPRGTITENVSLGQSTLGSTVVPSLKVLVVDDNKAAASMLSITVKMLGHSVATCYDGLEAVRMAGELRPNVILMDIGMPRLNGYEAARAIRAEAWGPSIRLIALTGWGKEDDKIKTREAGFDHHLVKPAAPADIQRLLEIAALAGPDTRQS